MSYVHLARANYENVQSTKFVRKFVHIFARPVSKLHSNFRCAEPLYCQRKLSGILSEGLHENLQELQVFADNTR